MLVNVLEIKTDLLLILIIQKFKEAFKLIPTKKKKKKKRTLANVLEVKTGSSINTYYSEV
jgi:hypothetical protein